MTSDRRIPTRLIEYSNRPDRSLNVSHRFGEIHAGESAPLVSSTGL